jgi:hypothetical protein
MFENRLPPNGVDFSSSALENWISIGAEEEEPSPVPPPRFNVIGSMVSRPPISTSARPLELGGGGGAEAL